MYLRICGSFKSAMIIKSANLQFAELICGPPTYVYLTWQSLPSALVAGIPEDHGGDPQVVFLRVVRQICNVEVGGLLLRLSRHLDLVWQKVHQVSHLCLKEKQKLRQFKTPCS
jgi:hypothetical protein